MPLVNATAQRLPFADGVFQCVTTSPPYWGLRAYSDNPPMLWGGDPACAHVWAGMVRPGKTGGHNSPKQQTKGSANYGEFPPSHQSFCERCGAWMGCYGLEPTIDLYVEHTVSIFREVWRVMRDDATLWLNLGDCYAGAVNGTRAEVTKAAGTDDRTFRDKPFNTVGNGLKPKDLCGVPWRVALALQADGWWLRRDVIWAKPNPMPESVYDRPTTAHEYIFMMTKAERYFYDAEAVREKSKETAERVPTGWDTGPGPHNGKAGRYKPPSSSTFKRTGNKREQPIPGHNHGTHRPDREDRYPTASRNLRSVWNIATQPYSGASDDWVNYDYVGRGGKPYRASQDCPVHGHLYRARTSDTPECDAQPIELLSGNPGIADHPEPLQSSLPDAMTSHSSPAAAGGSARLQMTESMGESRTLVDHPSPTLGERKIASTNHMSTGDGQTPDSLDLLSPANSEPAKSRNKRSRKTGRAGPIASHDSASVEMNGHTLSISLPRAPSGLVDRTPANKSGAGFASGETAIDPSEKMIDRIGHIDIGPYDDCACIRARTLVDHFATFPEAIAERCILAGTSAAGACAECGAPWERVVDKRANGKIHPAGDTGGIGTKHQRESHGLKPVGRQEWQGGVYYVTVGWAQGCDCPPSNPVPCHVLDPFVGSGTVVQVAKRLGRRGYGADLSLTYLRENALPRAEGRQTDESMATLPLFGGGSEVLDDTPKQDKLGKRTYAGFNARWDAKHGK